MPTTCAVATCKNNGRNAKQRGIVLHSFPKDEVRVTRWVYLCKRKDYFVPKHSAICSEHFDEADYERDLRAELLKTAPKRILKSTAEPKLNLPEISFAKTSDRENIHRSKRYLKRQNKQLIKELLVQATDTKNINNDCTPIETVTGLQSDMPVSLPTNKEEINTTLDLENENRILKLEIDKLKTEIAVLKERLLLQENTILQENKRWEKCSGIFTHCQKQVLITGKCQKWSSEDIAKAVTLRALSRKAYDYVTHNLLYPFPSECTIKRRLSIVKCPPGIIRLSLEIMRQQINLLEDLERDVILSFDEMKVQTCICYDNIDDCFRGPHNYVQVFIVRSLAGKWKQPVFYDFDCPVTKQLLFKIIASLEEIGFRVRGFVSDMGGSNRKLLSDLSIKPGQTFITNPYCPERKIWAFCDIPHVLKLLRNHLLDSGFVLADGKYVTKTVFENLVETNYSGKDLQYCYKLTNSHLILSGTERQNVRKAVELLSETVSKAILYQFPKHKHVAEFVKIINDGFDVLNSRLGLDPVNYMKSGYGLFKIKQDEALDKLSEVCSSMRVVGRNTLLPFQNGFLISIESIKCLYDDLASNGYTFIMASKINQDVLESYFSQLRGLGLFYDHPTPISVIQRMKALLVGKNASNIFTTGNLHSSVCENSEDFPLTATVIREIINKNEDEELQDTESKVNDTEDSAFLDTIFREQTENLKENDMNENNFQENKPGVKKAEDNSVETEKTELLEYLAGYIAYRMKKKYPQDATKTSVYGEYTNTAPQKTDWLSMISRGKLMRPTREWLIQVYKLENDFQKFHGSSLNYSKKVMDTFGKLIVEKYPDIDEFALRCYGRTRGFMRMKALNKQKYGKKRFSKSLESRKGTKKMKKIVK